MKKLNINFDSIVNQQESGEHNYVIRISIETVSQNVSTPHKSLTEYWFYNDLHLARTNLIFATCAAKEDEETKCRAKTDFRKKNVT
ncbi:unnamed protein product [Hymenolepis diminuta]|uniref:PLAT domain-containing protein n=1 Tax=Hymenolepis diminuta TaxID=6216 RepID=A0A0R3SQY1_HYMDI|nr:unnamed protein product [Hymenolepis diminuta]